MWSENKAGMVGHDLAALNTNTNTAISEVSNNSQERRIPAPVKLFTKTKIGFKISVKFYINIASKIIP